MEYDRKKEADPLKTVEKARKILADLDIMTMEAWKDIFDPSKEEPKSFSVRVDIPSCGVGSNGKGTTRRYALASAYGELMERLQNLILFPVERFTRESLQKEGFLYFPDEKTCTLDEIANAEDVFSKTVFKDFYRNQFLLGCGIEERKKVIHTYLETETNSAAKNMVTWPFYSVKEDKTIYLWNRFVTYLHGSNGMCAGNTPEEAIVQGMSEIFERYASTEILAKGIIPPEIPEEEYRQYGTIAAVIDEIEQMGPFKILVKDCSLGKGLPVCAVVLVDTEQQRYCASFGCHPHLPVSVERCLTEMLQGYTPRKGNKNDTRLISIDINSKTMNPYLNVKNMHSNGKGMLHPEFFMGTPSYEYKPFADMSKADNRQMLKYCIDLAFSLSSDVLIRDVSYLGFPAYFIIIPGISHYAATQNLIRLDTAYASLGNLSQYRGTCEDSKLKILLVGLNRWEQSSSKESLAVEAYKLKIAVLLMLKSYKLLIDYLEYQLSRMNDAQECLELSALLKTIKLLSEGYQMEQIEKMIKLFYSEGQWEKICSHWLCENPLDLVLADIPEKKANPMDCEVNKVFCRLKSVYAQKNIVQQDLGKLFR